MGNKSREWWPSAKSLMKRDGLKAPASVHGPLGITRYHSNEKTNVIAGSSENKFTYHDLCDENHERQVETRVQDLLASVDDTPLGKVRLHDVRKLASSLKLRKACGLDGIPDECLRHLPKRPLVRLTHLFNHCLRLSHFPKPWKEANPIRNQNSLKIYFRLASCLQQASYSRKLFCK
jgi:hypothetical protein